MGRDSEPHLRRVSRLIKVRWQHTADWALMSLGPSMSLRFKLAAPVLVTTAVGAVVLSWFVVGLVRTQIDTAYDQQADSIAVGVDSIFTSNPNDIRGMDRYLANLVGSQPDLISVRIHGLDSGGPVIASSMVIDLGQTGMVEHDELTAIYDGVARQDRSDSSTLQTVRPLRIGGILYGAVVISSSTTREDAAVYGVTLAIGAGSFVAIILESTFVLMVLNWGVLRRARRLQLAIKAVETGNTSVRLEEGSEPPARDEMFNLARQVDHMIGRLDDRQRADAVIRRLGQRALEGATTVLLLSEGLAATRQALGLEKCYFVRQQEGGAVIYSIDDRGVEVPRFGLPVWVGALISVAVKERKPILADRMGQSSRFLEAGAKATAQAAIVPLPRTSGVGEALVAIAPPGGSMPEAGVAMLEAVAATIAESLQRQHADEARTESAIKSKVMAAVSHEIRNPLNSIMGFTGLVLSNTHEPLTDKQRRQLGFVQMSATSMLSLVNNYLDLAKTRSGSLPVMLEGLKLGPLVEEVAGMMQPIAAAKNVTIKTSTAPDTNAEADAAKLRQVLTNLVSNAIKFTPEAGRVYVRSRTDKESTRIVVSDTGVGIAKDQVNLVFTEFAKIDAAELAKSKGTGLGLALSKGFVDAMGGSIHFYSRRGRGTTFVIKLPVAVVRSRTRQVVA